MIINNDILYIEEVNKQYKDLNLSHYIKYSKYCATNDIFLVDVFFYSFFEVCGIDKFFELIPNDIILKVKNKEIILGIYCTWEPFNKYRLIDIIYEKMIIQYEMPESQILYISGSIDFKDYILQLSKKLNKEPIKLEVTCICAEKVKDEIRDLNIKCSLNNDTKKKFLFLNKHGRPHRTGLLCLLHNKDLLKHGYTSYLQTPDLWEYNYNITEKRFPNIKSQFENNGIKEKLPLYLDIKPHVITNNIENGHTVTSYSTALEFSMFLLKYYYQSYFSIVTETLFNNTDPRSPTEKIFKCIAYKHPFVLVSCPNSLDMLRFFGFKTFHPLINEDYDLETDDSKRLLMIADEVERLCNLSEPELKSFKEQALEIVEYNYNHLVNTDTLIYKLL